VVTDHESGVAVPPPPRATNTAELAKLRYQAYLDRWEKVHEADEAKVAERTRLKESRWDKQVEDERSLRSTIHESYLEVAKDSVARSLTRANYVSAGAGAIATSYTALLALAFGAGEKSTPMPAIGALPAVFLGIALVLSVAYAAYLSEARKPGRYLPAGFHPNLQEKRLVAFVSWVSWGVHRRSWALRLSIVSLGLGVILMPCPFLALTTGQRCAVIVVSGLAALSAIVTEVGRSLRARKSQKPDQAPGQQIFTGPDPSPT
jgi:hypothetical protein